MRTLHPSRRDFIKTATCAMSALGGSFINYNKASSQTIKSEWAPKISENIPDLSDQTLQWMRQLGMKHVVFQGARAGTWISDIDAEDKGYWTGDDVIRAKRKVESFGMELSSIMIPIKWYPKVCLGQPGRDEEIERVVRSIRAAGKAAIPVLEWRMWPDFFWDERVGYKDIPGRGGAMYRTFDYNRVLNLPPFEEIGKVSREEMWDRMLYFAKPIIAAAEEAGVKLSCHPNDPPVPEMRGVARILISIEAFERLLDEVPSPANGVTFCQGTITEMGVNVIEAIRRLGRRNKIHHVHLRGVRGTIPQYQEVFIDEGDVDMFEALKAYKEVGYAGTIVSDHTPQVAGDTLFGHAGRSFSHGYIRAMVQRVNASS